jgi:hypothetical protein
MSDRAEADEVAVERDEIAALGNVNCGWARERPGNFVNPRFAAVGRSGHHTTARDMEELLAREWDDDARDS